MVLALLFCVSVFASQSIFGVFLFILAKIYVVNYMFDYDVNIRKIYDLCK